MGGKPKRDYAAEAANAERQAEIERINAENEKKMKQYEYTSLFNERTRKARTEAEGLITAERTKGIEDSSKLLTNYQAQERRRLFEARKGAGQAGVEDNLIGVEKMKQAQSLLNRGADYWESKRTVAGDTAYGAAKKKFLSEVGTEEDYISGGSI